MTPESAIERLEAAEKAMSGAPWSSGGHYIGPDALPLRPASPVRFIFSEAGIRNGGGDVCYLANGIDLGFTDADAHAIALLRNAAPALLAVARAAAEEHAQEALISFKHDSNGDCALCGAFRSLVAAVEAGA